MVNKIKINYDKAIKIYIILYTIFILVNVLSHRPSPIGGVGRL